MPEFPHILPHPSNFEVNWPESEAFRVAAQDTQDADGSAEPATAQLLYALARAHGCTRLVEVGVFRGCTTLWLALAASQNDGELLAIDTEHYVPLTEADRRLREAELRDHVSLRAGKDLTVLQTLSGTFMAHPDFFFLDGDHSYEHIDQVFRLAYAIAAPGALICLHDVNYVGHCAEAEWLAVHYPHALRIGREGYGLAVIQKLGF